MKKQKMTYLSSGIVGLAGLALMGFQANEAQAATTGTVNYADGATTVWTSPEVGQKPTRYLTNNQNVTIKNTKQVYGQTWYQLADNEWVAGEFVKTGVTTPAASTTAAKDTITVNYKSGATTIWTNTTAAQPTGAYLTYGKTQNVIASKSANGVTWYQLENKGWVPSSYVVLNNPSLAGVTPITDAPAVTPVATATPAASTTTTPTATTATSESTTQTSTTQQAPVASQSSTTTPAAPAQQQSSVATSSSTSQATQTSQTSTSVAPAASTQPSAPAQQQSTTQTQSTTNTTSSANTTAPSQSTNTNNSTATSGNAQSVVSAALSQIGTPYVWGGSTPGVGLDCSGLVQYAYSRAGVSLGRITTAQEGAGQRVSLNSLQPGDIIFWGGAGASYHDAIYIGGGQYVHAPQPGESVKIGTISSYFMPSFAVRVL